MKRFLSVLIALVLVLSMFSATAIAFADGNEGSETTTKHGPVTFNDAKFKTEVFDKFELIVQKSESFMLDIDWLYDAELVRQIFPGINWFWWPKENIDPEGEDYTLTYDLGEYEDLNKGYYCPVCDEFYDEDELVEGKCPSYNNAEHQAADNGSAPLELALYSQYQEAKHKETEHFKLAEKPTAGEGKEFAGWTIEFSGQPTWREGRVYDEKEEIAMPATTVTVRATWKDKPVVDEDEGEENGDTPSEPAEPEEPAEEEVNIPEDKIYVLYCNENSDPKAEIKDWISCEVTGVFNVSSDGWWSFRFAVVDGYADEEAKIFDHILVTTHANVEKAIEDGQTDEKVLLGMDLTLKGYTGDVLHPVVEISESLQNKADTGLTVGVPYSISTTSAALKVSDPSGWSATYEVYKRVGTKVPGADEDGWLLIYDSTKKADERVTEGYDNCISQSGQITPLASDVTGETMYRIVYSVTDDNGFYGVESADSVEEYHPTVEFKVNAATAAVNPKIEAWKVVLYVIAGLSAVGIVVLLFVKPKEAPVADARYTASDDKATGGKDEQVDQGADDKVE